MFQYIISCKNRNKMLFPDDRENLKARVAIYIYTYHIYIYNIYIDR